MSRDVVLTDPEGERWSIENLSTQRWLEGHAPGAEAALAWLTEHAVKLFREGKDVEAKFLRETVGLARVGVVGPLKAKAQRHAEDFPIHPEGDGE